MVRIEPNELGAVTVLGHALTFRSFFCDLRMPSALERLKQEAVKEDETNAEMIEVYLRAVAEILSNHPSDWGNGEDESNYLNAMSDEDWHLRALVALNGKYPEKTSKDRVVAVRVCTMQSIINKKSLSIESGDIGWLDDMAIDTQWSVRQLVAQYGKKEHLDVLVNDENAKVRMVVGSHGIEAHLDMLASDDNRDVRRIACLKGNERHEKLAATKELEQMKVATLRPQ